jgi:hypothetical protein
VYASLVILVIKDDSIFTFSLTWLQDFKAAFEDVNGHNTFVNDASVFHSFGFSVSQKTEKVCLACKQIAKSRGGRCCSDYSQDNRRLKHVIFGMTIACLG